MIICSSNNIDFIQGVIAYGNEPSITDWRIANSNGVFNILNSKSNNASLSILENSNVGIGIANPSSSLDVNGDINITGNYKINNRDVLNDTSNYVLSTSNILVNRILTEVRYTSNYIGNVSIGGSGGGSSQWTTLNANIYYNTCNVGIGTTNPINQLHIYNDVNETTSLTIQNNKPIQLPTTLPTEITSIGASSTTIGTFERCITFPYSGSASTRDYTFTTTEDLICDILIVGGGASGGSRQGGGGGAGAMIYLTNQPLNTGSYTISVGKGGASVPAFNAGNDGVSSSIVYSTTITLYLARGGGRGGIDGTSANSGGSSGGQGGGPSFQNVVMTPLTTNTPIGTYGNAGGRGYSAANYNAGGGGGAGGIGVDAINSTAGSGGAGLACSITGSSVIYAAGGGGGAMSGATGGAGGSSGIGGAGSTSSANANPGTANTGSGGGGAGFIGGSSGSSGAGGSGVVIIRYRKSSKTNASIELIRGLSNDSNRDYKIGNYDGDFKIFASFSNVDTEYFKISPSGPSIYNPTGSPNWATTSDIRIKENIENASYDKCYENINNLGLFRFNYIKEFNNNNKDIRQLGFIAQEVNEIFPKAVSSYNFNNGDLSIPNLLSIDITQINYSLYGAVKKLIEISEDTETRIKKLENLLYVDTSNISIDTSNIALDTSNISIDTSNITIDTSNLSIDTSNIALDTSNIVIDTSNITLDTSNIALDTSNITIDTSNIAIDTSNI